MIAVNRFEIFEGHWNLQLQAQRGKFMGSKYIHASQGVAIYSDTSQKAEKSAKITVFDKKGRSSKDETCLAPVS